MTLYDKVKEILNDFDNIPSDEIVKILTQIQPYLKSDLTRNYLYGKIQDISGTPDSIERKRLCKNLKPYLDWYIQGI